MLQSLLIQDFALIEHTEIDFGAGLNIITGETGAGKSILIGALNMVLGERAQTHVIRSGKKQAIAEAVFVLNDSLKGRLDAIVEEESIELEGKELILRRQIKSAGSRAFINDQPVSIQLLRKVGDLLVDLHGQHDHQLLLKAEYHRLLIDQMPEISVLLSDYQNHYFEWKGIQSEMVQLARKQKQLEEKVQLYEFQWKELEEAGLYEEEEEELLAEMKKLDSAEENDAYSAEALELIQADEVGLEAVSTKIEALLKKLAENDESFDSYVDEMGSALVSIQETARYLENFRDQLVFDPSRLEALRQRYRQLRKLEQKYGMNIIELIAYKEEIARSLKDAGGFEEELNTLSKKQEVAFSKMSEAATKLHKQRQEVQEKLCRNIEACLKSMSIPYANIALVVRYRGHGNKAEQFDEFGADEVWFEISLNKGEDRKPLADIASGGEISRVMLAFKSVMAEWSSMPVMVFDEIDSGISGSVSEQVGRVMRSISDRVQILAITHQPQIASQADHHYKVQKREMNERTTSAIERLDEDTHVREVAALMSGKKITESTLSSAKELIIAARSA